MNIKCPEKVQNAIATSNTWRKASLDCIFANEDVFG